MSDLISRSALIEDFRKDKEAVYSHVFCHVGCDAEDSLLSDLEQMINNQPTIEAVPVVHGQWIEVHEHMWRKDEDGEICEWAWESGFHNGATCELCGYSPCVHCEPDYKTTECREISYKCSDCGAYKKDTSSFCPECGADMRKGGVDQ